MHHRSAVALGAMVFVAAFAVRMIGQNMVMNIYDEAIMVVGATRLLDGELIHRDFYVNYGPLQFYALAGLFKVFGPSLLVARLWDGAMKALVCVAVFHLARRGGGGRAGGLVAAGMGAIWLTFILGAESPNYPALAAALASVLILAPREDGRIGFARMLGGGVAVAVTTLVRYDVGMALLVAELATITALTCWFAWGRPGLGALLLRRLSLYLLGFCLIVGPTLAIYHANGMLAGFVFDIWTFPSQFYIAARSVPFPARAAIGADPMVAGVYLPVLALGAGLMVALGVLVDQRPGQVRPELSPRLVWTMCLLAGVTAVFFAKAVVRIQLENQVMAIVCANTLLVLFAAHRTLWRRGAVLTVLAVALASGLATLGAARGVMAQSAANITRLAREGCVAPVGVERLSCFQVPPEILDAVRIVVARAQPGDRVFSAVGRHDKIFANTMGFYFLTGLRPATKWAQMDASLQNKEAIQTEMVTDLSRTCPSFVMQDTRFDTEHEPNASAVSSGVTILDRYLDRIFRPVATFGSVSVLERREGRCGVAG